MDPKAELAKQFLMRADEAIEATATARDIYEFILKSLPDLQKPQQR